MKKFGLVLMVAVFGVMSASAQFEAGRKTLTAKASGLDFTYAKTKDVDKGVINFDLGAQGSYFVIDNLAITAGVGFDYLKYYEEDAENAFTFTIGAKYYFYKGLYGGLAYEGLKASEGDLVSAAKVEVGYDIYISDNVFFEPAVFFGKGLDKLKTLLFLECLLVSV